MAVRYYPAFLDLRGKRVLVVGGGPIGRRKARSFGRCGARVKVVSRAFRPKDLQGAFLVCAATDREQLNARISALCRKKRIWVNVADRPALCDFIVPAVAAKEPLTVAISTGGASPGMAKFLRRRMAQFLKPEYVTAARWLAGRRKTLLKVPMRRRKRLVNEILSGKMLELARKDPKRAKTRWADLL